MWSHGSCVPSYEFRVGILNLDGKGWLVIDTVKKEFVLWTRSSTWLVLLMESLISSMIFFIWSISFSRCGTQRLMVPLDYSPPSALFSASPASELCPGPFVCRWQHCLCLLTSRVNSWFWCVRFAMAINIDYSCCWTDAGSGTVISGGAWLGWLKAFPLSWCSGLMAINLVQTMQPLFLESEVVNTSQLCLYSPQTAPTDETLKISRLNASGCVDDLIT